ncbi:MAG: hypothetical protein H5T84_01310, partial [Thermoleophilia bacterium]|nr:hypothetical protein [Thermoleophilia bacterium]
VGSYAINNSLFDVFLAVSLGVLGYGMTKLGFPLPPLLLGLILGPMAESNFRRSLTMSHGDPMIFVTRPISLVLLILAVGMALWPALARVLSNRGARREAKADPHAG